MAMVFSLPGRQSGFEELARSAAARRGAPLSEAAMMQLAQGMGAEDPFPIGMQFSNDQPVAKPLTKEQQARANMAAVMAQLAGRKEQGIAKYEQGVADKQLARERIPRSSEGMTGIDEVANAMYRQRSQQARDDNARSMAPLAQVLAQVSQQSGPQGNLWRRDPRAAVAMQAAQLESQDRGLERTSDSERFANELLARQAEAESTRTFQEKMAGQGQSHAKTLAELEANTRKGIAGDTNWTNLLTTGGGIIAQLFGQLMNNSTQRSIADAGNKTQMDVAKLGTVPPDQQRSMMLDKGKIEAIISGEGTPESKLAALNEMARSVTGAPAAATSAPGNTYAPNIGTLMKTAQQQAPTNINDFLDSISDQDIDTPDKKQQVAQFIRDNYGTDHWNDWQSFVGAPYLKSGNVTGENSYNVGRQNARRKKLGLPPMREVDNYTPDYTKRMSDRGYGRTKWMLFKPGDFDKYVERDENGQFVAKRG